jgi:hypothetical protein
MMNDIAALGFRRAGDYLDGRGFDEGKIMAEYQRASMRTLLRAFQKISGDGLPSGFAADFDMLKHKDLDLSVRLGALLGFNALLLASAIQPISASPGSPLSLDAPTQPWPVLVITLGVLLLSISGYLCVRGILVGEEFDPEGIEESPEMLVRRLFAAFCRSIDVQMKMLRFASRFTIAGGAVTLAGCLWIMAAKMIG